MWAAGACTVAGLAHSIRVHGASLQFVCDQRIITGKIHATFILVFTARRFSIPSVRQSVRPSATRRYCVKMTARSTVQFALSDSKMCLVS